VTVLPRADALVLFGATGDLARRKIFPALYHLAKADRLDMPVIGVARSIDDDAKFRADVAKSINDAIEDADANVLDRLCRRIHLICGDYADPATFATLAATLEADGAHDAVHYLAIPPAM